MHKDRVLKSDKICKAAKYQNIYTKQKTDLEKSYKYVRQKECDNVNSSKINHTRKLPTISYHIETM